jgi:hypothetical protein
MAHTAQTEHTIHIHPQAPGKVPEGVACNGCGVCCLFEPCPLGVVLSGTRTGACAALRWQESSGQYRCGALVAPEEVLALALPRGARWLAPLLAPLLRRWGARWIAAGTGCDSSLEVVHSGSTTMPTTDSPLPIRAVARRSQP